VLPLDAVGNLASGHVSLVRRSIHGHLSRRPATTMVDLQRVDQAVARTRCRQQQMEEQCAVAVGQRLGASHVVAGGLGGLGRTLLIQLKLVDVKRRSVIRALEETHFGGPSGLEAAVGKVMDRLDLERQPSRPWYRRWWVWTIVGTAVAAAVIVPLAVRDSDPYENLTLP